MDELKKTPKERDFSLFKKAFEGITQASIERNKNRNPATSSYIASMTKEEIELILQDGNTSRLREVSRFYFYHSGFYRRTVLYFSTMLMGYYLLTPRKISSTSNKSKFDKKYKAALTYVDALNLEKSLPYIMTKIFTDGVYFGTVVENSPTEIVFRDLPPEYCRTVQQSGYGVPVLEMDMRFFDMLATKEDTKAMLKTFPRFVTQGYNKYKKDGDSYRWLVFPPNEGVAFTADTQRPPLVSIIPAIINLQEYRGLDRAIDELDLHRILVQKMPIEDGELMFSLEETEVIHNSVCKMLEGMPSVEVLTTFADVTTPALKDSRQVVNDNLEKVEKSVYSEAGISKELFSPSRAQSLEASLQNDLSYVLSIVNQIRTWIFSMLDSRFTDRNINFDFQILPVSFYNQKAMHEMYLKQAQSGYSKFLPAIASGTKQSNLIAMMEFENGLDIVSLLIPLQTSYTQGNEDDTGGAPTKEITEDKTEQNRETDNNI